MTFTSDHDIRYCYHYCQGGVRGVGLFMYDITTDDMDNLQAMI